MRITQFKWRNPAVYGYMYQERPLTTHDMARTKQSLNSLAVEFIHRSADSYLFLL